MQAAKRFSESAINKLKNEIEDAGGNEVFALGFIDDNKIISRIEVTARGNEGAVLALQERFESAANSGGDRPGAASSMSSPDVLIHNHPSGFLSPSDNDLAIASSAAEA